jgi:ABC-type molybdate transport system substrate-binding protein
MALASLPARSQERDLVVFVVASLKNALDGASALWVRTTGKNVVISYAASSALARQIEQGTPAAATAKPTSAEAEAFLAFRQSSAARPRFERQGFTILGAPQGTT